MKKFFNKIFFDINMSYKNTVIYAVITSIVVALLNVIPFLKGTSFVMPAETQEIWIVLALVVILNSKSCKDAIIKTFLYFIISQPLIYLIEVPFDDNGFNLFNNYGYWFIWTLLTIPGSFIAYQVKKNNILSSIILSIATSFLLFFGINGFIIAIGKFPYHLLSGIVCTFFSIYLIFLILKGKKERIVCLILTVLLCFSLKIAENYTSSYKSSNYIIDYDGVWNIESCDIECEMTDTNVIDIKTNKKGTYSVILKNDNNEYVTLSVECNSDSLNIKEVK